MTLQLGYQIWAHQPRITAYEMPFGDRVWLQHVPVFSEITVEKRIHLASAVILHVLEGSLVVRTLLHALDSSRVVCPGVGVDLVELAGGVKT